MAQGTVLAEILLEGDRTFRRAVEASGDQMDDAARDATTLGGALSFADGRLESVRGSALGAAFGLGRVAAQADDAGDELVEAGGQATTASGLFGTASIGTYGLSASLGTLSTTILSVAIPALVALSTTLVPLTATLSGFVAAGAGLGGAFAAVVGSGALAYGEDLNKEYQEQLLRVEDQIAALEELEDKQGGLTDAQRKELKQLKERKQELDDVEGAMSALEVRLGKLADEVVNIVAEWGSGFAPLIRDGLNAIPRLVRSVLDAVGGLGEFQSALRTIGGIAMDALPSIAGTLADVGREALPVFIDGLRWLQANGDGIFNSIMQTTRTIAPLLQDVGAAFVENLPAINEFGTALLKQLLPAVEDGIDAFGTLLGEIMAFTETEQFAEIMDSVRAGVEELGPEVQTLTTNLGDMFDAIIENAPALIDGFVAVADAVLDIINVIAPIITTLIDLIGGIAKEFARFNRRSEQQEQNLADQGVLGYLGGGLGDVLAGQQTPGITAPGSTPGQQYSQSLQQQRAAAREVLVKVESDDEKFDAYVDEKYDERSEQERRNATNRGFARRNFSR